MIHYTTPSSVVDKHKYRAIQRKYFLILVPLVSLAIVFLYVFAGKAGPKIYFYIGHSLLSSFLLWLGCVGIVSFLWKKYPWEHYPVKHIIVEVIAIIAFTNVVSLGLYKLDLLFGFVPELDISENMIDVYMVNLITLFITAIHEMVYFYKQWKLNFSKSVVLEKENVQAQYEALKAQLNPHFLFNSLNSLISMVDDNKQAVSYIDNLSDFLRYVLKSRNQELVTLEEELQMMNNYIYLMKSRFGETLQLSVDIKEIDLSRMVLPMALQMLVENAIKHNVVSKERPLEIKVSSQNSHIVVENNLQLKISHESTGQGQSNLRGRLRYFTNNEMEMTSENGKFIVKLPLIDHQNN